MSFLMSVLNMFLKCNGLPQKDCILRKKYYTILKRICQNSLMAQLPVHVKKCQIVRVNCLLTCTWFQNIRSVELRFVGY